MCSKSHNYKISLVQSRQNSIYYTYDNRVCAADDGMSLGEYSVIYTCWVLQHTEFVWIHCHSLSVFVSPAGGRHSDLLRECVTSLLSWTSCTLKIKCSNMDEVSVCVWDVSVMCHSCHRTHTHKQSTSKLYKTVAINTLHISEYKSREETLWHKHSFDDIFQVCNSR